MVSVSKRTVNNIVIYAMLLMVFMFNIDKFLPSAKQAALTPLLPDDAYVLKIDMDQYRLERVGQSWRWNITPAKHGAASPESQRAAWQRAKLLSEASPSNDVSNINPYIAVVWLAGEGTGRVYAIYPGDTTWVRYQQQWFSLHQATLEELLPWLTFEPITTSGEHA